MNLYAEYIMQNAGLDESQAGIKTAGRNINSPRSADENQSNGQKQRGTKKPLDESESGEWQSWLKAQHTENKEELNHLFMKVKEESEPLYEH